MCEVIEFVYLIRGLECSGDRSRGSVQF